MTDRPPATGDGVPIDPERLPTGSEKRRAVRAMFDSIAPRYDLVNRLMTLRLDVRWRKRTVTELGLTRGATVADVACGTGDLCRELEDRGIDAIGFDLSLGMLRAARTRAPLVHADILSMPLPDRSIDGATCGFALRNLVELPAFFAELARVVRPGGRVALLEVAQPERRLMRWGHEIYFGRIVPRIGGLLSDRAAYRYLPKSVAYLPDGAVLARQLALAGFGTVEHRRVSGGIAQLLTATRE